MTISRHNWARQFCSPRRFFAFLLMTVPGKIFYKKIYKKINKADIAINYISNQFAGVKIPNIRNVDQLFLYFLLNFLSYLFGFRGGEGFGVWVFVFQPVNAVRWCRWFHNTKQYKTSNEKNKNRTRFFVKDRNNNKENNNNSLSPCRFLRLPSLFRDVIWK